LDGFSVSIDERENVGDSVKILVVGLSGIAFHGDVESILNQKVGEEIEIAMLLVGPSRSHKFLGILCPDVHITRRKPWIHPVLLEVKGQGRATCHEGVCGIDEFLERGKGDAIRFKKGLHGYH
jgi:hypothetical protein